MARIEETVYSQPSNHEDQNSFFLIQIIALAVLAAAVAEQLPLAHPPIAIVRSSQVNPDQFGAHSSDFEAANGIVFQFSGSEGVAGGSNMVGSWSYPQEDGTVASFKFVADENGFQPESSLLPVAPAFPHPIPQFVLDQIEFARLEDEAKAREGAKGQA
ncbi:cuticle protein AM1274-like [Penaeus chinensis]|uniref:cuticle protein AM1274-like n=1 Tax=Penaeus chinensis TaxID=139456 RepID=UPI001FB72AF3|nr:cuticle protein AM1274-like [Penaeus chinensis]